MIPLQPTRHDWPCDALANRLPGGWPALKGNARANADRGDAPLPPREYRHASYHHAALAAQSPDLGGALPAPRLASSRAGDGAHDLHALSHDHWRPSHVY